MSALVERRVSRMHVQVEAAWQSWRLQRECGTPTDSDDFDAWRTLGLAGLGAGSDERGFGAGHGRLGGSHSLGLVGDSRSMTNNQVEGVDEADFVKTDELYLYLAVNGALRIVDAQSLRVVSVTKLTGHTRQMLLAGDRAVVFTAIGEREGTRCTDVHDCHFAGDNTRTTIAVIDVADRIHPRLVRQVELSGALVAARAIGPTVHAVVADNDGGVPEYDTVPRNVPYCRMNEAAVHAKFERLKQDNERRIRAHVPAFPTVSEDGRSRELCEMMQTRLPDGEAFTTLLSFDILSDGGPLVASTVQSQPGAVYASEGALFLAVRHQRGDVGSWYGFYGSHDELSDIHKFRIGQQPGETRYLGSGVVPGHVVNQFAMDEHSGYFRIATTRGRVPGSPTESTVSILAEDEGGNLLRVGAIEHIAPTEEIRAVRFDGDRGYVVTFKKTDPLYVLDLARPHDPQILGELKIPGYSTYLHRIDQAHLLSIGYDSEDLGGFAYVGGILLQLFDVTHLAAPELLFKERIGGRGSGSEAATDHLAFNYMGERGLLAVPLTVCEGGGSSGYGEVQSFSGLAVYRISTEHGFERLGGIDHGNRDAPCHVGWSRASTTVTRSVIQDDAVFSIAPDRIKVRRIGELGTDIAQIALTP